MINIGPNTLGIGIAIRLRDQFTAQAAAINSQFNSLYGNAQRVQKANLAAARNFGVGLAAAGVMSTRGLMNTVNTAADFEFIMKTIQGITSASNQEIQTMTDLALKLGTETIYTADEIASTMEYMVRSGYQIKDVYKSIKAVVDLGAAAGGKQIGGKAGIADYMASIMHQFNLDAAASSRVADILAKTANISSSDVEDIAQAMKYTAFSAHTLNISLEETSAMLAVLSNAGLRGGVAGRSLNNMLTYLSTALGKFRSQRQADAFQEIGLGVSDVLDSRGNLKSMSDILGAFGKNLRGMPKVDQLSALTALFNIRGQRALTPLLESSLKIGYNYEQSLEQLLAGSSGYAESISGIIMDSVKGDLMILSDTWKTFKIEVGTTLGAVARPVARGLTWIINKMIAFAKTPIGKPIIILTAALSIAAVVAGTFLAVFSAIKLMTIGGIVSFANMGKTLVWAWTSATAAALRYATVSKGAMLTTVGNTTRWRSLTTGQFVKGPAGGSAVTSFLGKSVRFLGTTFGRLASGALFVVGVFTAFAGIKNVINLVLYAFGSLFQGLMFIVDYIANLNEGPIDAFTIARDKFKARQKQMIESLGLNAPGKGDAMDFAPRERGTRALNLKPLEQEFAEFKRAREARIQLNMDGKKVGEAILKDPYEEMRQLLQSKIN